MKKLSQLFKKFLALGGLVLVLLLTLGLFSKKLPQENLVSPLPKSHQTPAPPEICAWIPWWEKTRPQASLIAAGEKLKVISPAWYRLDDQGKFIEIDNPRQDREKLEILSLAKEAKIKILPTLGNDLDGNKASYFLNQVNWSEETDKLVFWAKDSGYQGWDIDWENIPLTDRDLFSQFIGELASAFKKHHLELSVAVHAQTGSPLDWPGALSHDYTRLGQAADQVRIMAYDFHFAGSDPGPVTPKKKLEEVIKFSLSTIPAEKIVIGLPSYGYDWSEKGGEPLQHAEIIERLQQNNGSWQHVEKELALKGEYQKDNQKHELWFENSQTMTDKIKLGQEFGINRFCFWSLGGEDSAFWQSNPSVF
jgi:spore germination protein YaaH